MENIKSQAKCNEGKTEEQLPRVKVLQQVQKNLAAIGISSDLISQAYPFNRKILMVVIMICYGCTSSSLYIFLEAKTFDEYTQSIYIFSACVLISIIFIITYSKLRDIFQFIDSLENVMNFRK